MKNETGAPNEAPSMKKNRSLDPVPESQTSHTAVPFPPLQQSSQNGHLPSSTQFQPIGGNPHDLGQHQMMIAEHPQAHATPHLIHHPPPPQHFIPPQYPQQSPPHFHPQHPPQAALIPQVQQIPYPAHAVPVAPGQMIQYPYPVGYSQLQSTTSNYVIEFPAPTISYRQDRPQLPTRNEEYQGQYSTSNSVPLALRNSSNDSGLKNGSNKSVKSASSDSEDNKLKRKRKRLSISCTTCRKRKIKCDRKRPTCGACQKNNVPVHLCIYDDSPWVSSLVKEQTLQTEIESLVEQRNSLKQSLASKDKEITRLSQQLERQNSDQKNISINSLIHQEEPKNDIPKNLELSKFYTFRDGECRGLLTLDNFIRLTPILAADLELKANKRSLTKKYKEHTLTDLAHELPSFKKIESKFQYLFDINYNHEFQFLAIFKNAPMIKSMFYKVFNKKTKISFDHVDQLELCYCLLILKFGIIFNKEEEFSSNGNILVTCYDILTQKLENATASMLLLENLILFNNIINIISPTLDDSNLTIPALMNLAVSKLNLQQTSQDKKLWFTLLYQDYFIAMTTGAPLIITEFETNLEIDEDNYDDIAWETIIMLRRCYLSYRSPNAKAQEPEDQIMRYYEKSFIKFDSKFYKNFHIRTSSSGINQDKRLIVSLLCLEMFLSLRFLKHLDDPSERLECYLIFGVIQTHWILDQMLCEESFSKNRCLQISLAPILKQIIPKLITMALHFTGIGAAQSNRAAHFKAEDRDLWKLSIQDAEKAVLQDYRGLEVSNFQFEKFMEKLREIQANALKVDLFSSDTKWISDLESLVAICEAQLK